MLRLYMPYTDLKCALVELYGENWRISSLVVVWIAG